MSLGGVMGKILNVDLGKKTIEVEEPPQEVYADFLGGYGLAAYYLYQRQPANVDPLGPDNIFGLTTGPLTGTQAITGNRFTAVGKSPKTNTWGDANCGGNFGPGLKYSGYDGVFFTGIAEGPTYLLINEGKAELCDASDLWGLDSNETEQKLLDQYGKNAYVACIGPSGERCSLLACVMNDFGRAAGRSGLGAVMGSKKLKAVVAVGTQKVPVADPEKLKDARKKCTDVFKTSDLYALFNTYGTAGIAANAAQTADTPIKNWKGVPADFPEPGKISDDSVNAHLEKPYGCDRCPIACGGLMNVKGGKYAGEAHKPEYETLGVFGTMCLNDSVESIIKLNDICNRMGMDTISAGATACFALECYENGLITKEDGLELTWGNDDAIVKLTEMLGTGEGKLGEIFGDGVKAAAEKLGQDKCEEFAMHVAGEELPMHDPRLNPGLATSYQVDATPGRHTQMGAWFVESGFAPPGADKYFTNFEDKYTYTGKAEAAKFMSCYGHVVNAAGMCMFGACCSPADAVPEFLTAIMGVDISMAKVVEIGWRIASMRMAFTVREGNVPAKFKVPGRMIGKPPLEAGPLDGVEVDNVTQTREYLESMGWDPETAAPLPDTMQKLGLSAVASA